MVYNRMYAVVYGPDWEDLAYFSDLHKAKRKLIVQTNGFSEERPPFYPFIYEYNTDDHGVYHRRKGTYLVNYKAFQDALAHFNTVQKLLEDRDLVDRLVEFSMD